MFRAKLLRGGFASACLVCATHSVAVAAVSVCADPAERSSLSLAFAEHGKSAIDPGPGDTNQKNHELDLIFRGSSSKAFVGAGHNYTVLDINGIVPETNGHLHTTFFVLHMLKTFDGGELRISIAPTLSASSNAMRNLDEYAGDAFQLLGAVVWRQHISEQWSWRFGLCGDHRFGDYQLYPLISAHWRPNADWMIQLGFPTSQLRYQVSTRLASRLRIMPDGNEWFVLDAGLTNSSQFIYEAYALEWIFDWQVHEKFSLSASIGRQLDSHYEMTLLDGTRARLQSDSVTRIGASLEWRF
jgi:hypothetical protein